MEPGAAPAVPSAPAYVRRRPFRGLSPEARARRRRRRVGLAAFAVLALLAASWWWTSRPRAPRPVEPPTAEDAGLVAVLPWSGLGAAPADEWLGAALTRMTALECVAAGVPRVVAGAEVTRATRELGGLEDGRAFEALALHLGAGRLLDGRWERATDEPRTLALELRMVDAAGGELAAATARAPSDGLAAAVSALVAEVLAASATRVAGAPAGPAGAALAPADPTALEPYARGIADLERGDPGSARAYLRQAVAVAPRSAEVARAEAEAWGRLGHVAPAAERAARALELGAQLPPVWKLNAAAEAARWRREPARAATLYRRLREVRPRQLEHALAEVEMRLAAGDLSGAAGVVATLRTLPPPDGEDPRIELAAAAVAGAEGDGMEQLHAGAAALTQARARQARGWQAEAHLAMAEAALRGRRLAEAEESVLLARRLYRGLGDARGLARAALAQAQIEAARDHAAAAEDSFQSALAGFRRAGDLGAAAELLERRALALADLDQPQRALDGYGEAVELRRELGDRAGQVAALRGRAALALALGDARAAESDLRLALSRLGGDDAAELGGSEPRPAVEAELEAEVRLDLSAVLTLRERFPPARLAAEHALGLAGDGTRVAARAHLQLAELDLVAGALAAAREHREAALAIYRSLGDAEAAARARLSLAELDLAAGRAASARRSADELIPSFRQAGSAGGLLAAQLLAVRARTELGELSEARRALSAAAAAVGDETASELALAVSLADAQLIAAEGDPMRAVRVLQRALTEAMAEDASGSALELRLALGEIELGSELAVAGRTRLAAVREDAEARGYVWVAQRADAALRGATTRR